MCGDFMDFVDVSDNVKKKDKFMLFIIVSLVFLVVSFLVIYLFGYNFLKPYIKV